jgi:hypothetical protein
MLTRFQSIALALLVIARFTSCSSDLSGNDLTGKCQKIPVDFKILVGEGGGFTGERHGYTLAADGTIVAWSAIADTQSAQEVGTMSPDTVRGFWDTAREQRLMERGSQTATGNFVQTISITARDSTVTFSWIPVFTGSPRSDIADFRFRCYEAIHAALKR